jgi:ribosomal protein S18 acetylase RimI-like enzyme
MTERQTPEFSPFSLRAGGPGDVEALIDLMLVSSHDGLIDAWEGDRLAGETWRDAARRQVGQRDGELGYGHAIVAQSAGRPVGMLLFNALPEPILIEGPGEGGARLLLARLLNRALPALMIREIAVDAGWRGRGVARALVHTAAVLAGNARLPRLVLTVNAANGNAVATYRRLGFALAARGPAFRHRHWPAGSVTLLMQRAA